MRDRIGADWRIDTIRRIKTIAEAQGSSRGNATLELQGM
jgi:hypothetical protein